jgi:hypothetical protein
MSDSFTLHPAIDAAAMARAYASRGRVSISPFIPEQQADRLREHLLAREGWQLRLHNFNSQVFELSPEDVADWGPQKISAIRTLVAPRPGEKGFGYTQEFVNIIKEPGRNLESSTILGDFGTFLNSDAVLDLIKTITGETAIDFGDSFATRYGPGDYATMHNDGIDARKAAYVYGLTKSWRAEWGGLLLFHGPDREIDGGLVPGFNVLDLFKIPVEHSVSVIAPFASEPRLSVTGWFQCWDANQNDSGGG